MILNCVTMYKNFPNLGDICIHDIMTSRIKNHDSTVIVGGGGIIFGYTPEPVAKLTIRNDFNNFLDIIEKYHGKKKLIMLGVGATRPLNPKQIDRMKKIKFDLITARDTETRAYLETLGFESELCSDIAFLSKPKDIGVKKVYVNLYKWFNPDQFIFSKIYEGNIEYISCWPRVDHGNYYTWQQVVDMFNGIVVSTRLHPLIWGILKGCEIIDMTMGKAQPTLNMYKKYGLKGMIQLAERNFTILAEVLGEDNIINY